MSDESMWSEWDLNIFELALEDAEKPFTPPEGDGVLHPAPDFEEGGDSHED